MKKFFKLINFNVFIIIMLLMVVPLLASETIDQSTDTVSLIGGIVGGFLTSLGGSYAIAGKWIKTLISNLDEIKGDIRVIKENQNKEKK